MNQRVRIILIVLLVVLVCFFLGLAVAQVADQLAGENSTDGQPSSSEVVQESPSDTADESSETPSVSSEQPSDTPSAENSVPTETPSGSDPSSSDPSEDIGVAPDSWQEFLEQT